MTYRHTLHIEAPVTRVFDFFRDPGNWTSLEPEGVEFTDVTLTDEGLGTHYSWTAKIAGFTMTGFNVFTEFSPERRITDRSSSSLEGTWSYTFEPDGTGTRLTVENQAASLWRLAPLENLSDWMAAKTHGPRFARLKAMLEEESRPGRPGNRSQR